jgi:phenylacetate-CoA ligase
MSRLVGRSDDMLVIRGVNVFPSEIEAVLLSTAELASHYTIVVDSTGPMPEMVVVCELAGPELAGQELAGSRLAEELSARLSDRLGVSGRVVVGSPGCVPRTEVGKTIRLVRRTPEVDERPQVIVQLMEDS